MDSRITTRFELQLASDARQRSEGEDAVISLIRLVGEDPTRDGLIHTPRRVLEAREMTEDAVTRTEFLRLCGAS